MSRYPHDYKLDHAYERLSQLRTVIERWVSDGCRVWVEAESDQTFLARVEQVHDLPSTKIGLLAGDILQNARSALDYLAYTLADFGAGWEGMTEAQATRAAFPVLGDEDGEGYRGRGPDFFEEFAEKRLETVDPAALDYIKDCQPFQDDLGWRSSPIWILHELARIDRHRMLHFGLARTGFITLDRNRSHNIKLESFEPVDGTIYFGEEAGGEVLAEIRAHPAKPDQDIEIQVKDAVTVGWDRELGDIVDDYSDVLGTLTMSLGQVRRVLDGARPFLIPPNPPSPPADIGDDELPF